MRYSATQNMDLIMVGGSYGHALHLMARKSADHGQVALLMVSLKKVERMHSIIRKMGSSQLQSWKSGRSKKSDNENKTRTSLVHIIVLKYLN
jgi:hypothetical protein